MIETLGHYKILDRIGAGGLGDVYRARDTLRGRTVALKVIDAAIGGDPERRERLMRDARAASAVSHPNIAALYEVGEDQGELFLAFEFVPGETLQAAIAGRPLNPRRAVDLALQVADALAEAHAAGLVHGRLASDAIIVTPKGNAKVIDLGFAAWTGRRLSRAGAPAGVGAASSAAVDATAPPEQVRGEPSDHRVDVFSLGALVFEMLTGRPFDGTAGPTLPNALGPIVSKALAADPGNRHDSIATLAAELRQAAAAIDARSDKSEGAHVSRVSAAPRRRSVAGLGVLLVLLVAMAGAAWWQRAAIDRAWRHSMGPPPKPAIVVMPLTVDGPGASTSFGDGLAEDLITRLGQTPGITVLGRAALRTYRNRVPSEVARDLQAGVVLGGTLHRDRDEVTVALTLTDPVDGASLWSGEYTRAVQDIFALQTRAAEDIAQALHLPLRLSAATARTSSRRVDLAAYELYLRGQEAAAGGQPASAAALYQAAVAADDGLPDAFAGLARALLAAGTGNKSEGMARRERIRTAAEHAYQLDPDLASANIAIALASPSLQQMLQYFKRAIDLDPSNAETYLDVADVLRSISPELSASFSQRALAFDPRTAGGRRPVPEWQPAIAPHEKAADAFARDREIASGALAGVLDAR